MEQTRKVSAFSSDLSSDPHQNCPHNLIYLEMWPRQMPTRQLGYLLGKPLG